MAEIRISRSGDINVVFSDGNSITVPDADAWGVSPDYPIWHQYYGITSAGPLSEGNTIDDTWKGLLAAPAPGTLMEDPLAKTGSVTDTYGPGGVQHIVDPQNKIVVNVTLADGQFPGWFSHLLHPGLVLRHPSVIDDEVVTETIGIGNSGRIGPLTPLLNNLLGEFFFGGPGATEMKLVRTDPFCFPAHTPIAVSLTATRPIADIRVGDTVLAFDPAAALGRGALVPRRVARLYRSTTDTWIRLTWTAVRRATHDRAGGISMCLVSRRGCWVGGRLPPALRRLKCTSSSPPFGGVPNATDRPNTNDAPGLERLALTLLDTNAVRKAPRSTQREHLAASPDFNSARRAP